MELKNLKIFSFKNIEYKEFECNSKFNVIIGFNGSGKSSILDSVHYLCLTKSFFINNDSLNVNFNSDFFTIDSIFKDESQINNIKIQFKKGQKKVIKINEKAYSRLSEHIGKIPVVVISPYDNDLISGSSEERRRFIDSVISQTDLEYLNHLIQYNRIIVQRNFLLKTFIQKNYYDKFSLEIYNEPLKIHSEYIHKSRTEFINNFLPIFKDIYNYLSDNQSEKTQIKYDSSLNDNDYLNLLESSINKDRACGFTCFGIHKDDLIFSLFDFPIKKIGSQGQQKTFLIALKIAQYKYTKNKISNKPILLLDDIFDKLDSNRVNKLINYVDSDDFGQVFISHTKKEEIINSMNNIETDKINYIFI